MAEPQLEHRRQASPGAWEAAPVQVGRRRRWPAWFALVAVVVAVTLVASALVRIEGRAVRTAPAVPPGAPAASFDVRVRMLDIETVDNARLFGAQSAAADAHAVDDAVREVGDRVAAYLDAMFVAPATRFSQQPLVELLSDRARRVVARGDRAGLGALDVSVRRVEPAPVMVTARVLTSGGDVAFVAVRYDARARIVTADGASGELRQRARMVFVPDSDGWRADVVDVDLSVPAKAGGGVG